MSEDTRSKVARNFNLFPLNFTLPDPLRESGGHSKVEPPGPIPNPEVKRFCADGSWTIGPVRVGRRQFFMPLLSES